MIYFLFQIKHVGMCLFSIQDLAPSYLSISADQVLVWIEAVSPVPILDPVLAVRPEVKNRTSAELGDADSLPEELVSISTSTGIRVNDEVVELGDLSPALVIDPHHAESLFHVDVHRFMVGPSMSVGSHIND